MVSRSRVLFGTRKSRRQIDLYKFIENFKTHMFYNSGVFFNVWRSLYKSKMFAIWLKIVLKEVFQSLTFTQSTGYMTQCSIMPAIPPAIKCTDIRSVGKFSYSSSSIVIFRDQGALFLCKNERVSTLTQTSAIFKPKNIDTMKIDVSGFAIVLTANHSAVFHANSRVTQTWILYIHGIYIRF